MSHIAVAGGPYPADSATMINYQLNVYEVPTDRGLVSMVQAVTGQDQGVAKYYGNANEPYYKFAACTRGTTGTRSPLNIPFHLTGAGARIPTSPSDKFLAIWDQGTGNVFGAYNPAGTMSACPGGGHAGTLADPCQVSFATNGTGVFCQVTDYNSGPLRDSSEAWGSNGIQTLAGMIRMQEVVQGHIYHAIYLDIACTSGNSVYPNLSGNTTWTCAMSGKSNSTGMPNSSLIFLDYTDAQLADIKTKVDAWQYPFLEAMTKYGGYPGDTMAINSGGGISPGRPESEQAYNTLGIATPHPPGFSNFYTWLSSMPHSRCFTTNGGIKCQMPMFENVPLEGGKDITAHMHVADQCVPKAMAGVSGGCP